MSKLLIYYPSNRKTVALQSTILAIRDSGIETLFLSLCKRGELHEFLEQNGIPVFDTNFNNTGFTNLIKQSFKLIRFCAKHKITTVHSHLQEANKIMVICQYFIKARVIIFRHHFNYQFDGNETRNEKEVFGEKLINYFAKEIIVPSLGVYNAILKHEKINSDKLSIVPYLYDFSQYNIPKEEADKDIFRIVICSRFIKAKRHILLFEALENLLKLGYSNFICRALDDGPEKKRLEQYINNSPLKDKVIFTGNISDIMEELNACDVLIHPSLYDASNSVVKEAGLLQKPVMVCNGVGDFDEYIVHNKNGILLDPVNTKQEIIETLIDVFDGKINLKFLGTNLKKTVVGNFSVSQKNVNKYLNLIS